jgi:hypothetical protein
MYARLGIGGVSKKILRETRPNRSLIGIRNVSIGYVDFQYPAPDPTG